MSRPIIETFINGNLRDAKERSRKVGHKTLRDTAEEFGYNLVGATAVADYLKGSITFQQQCDIVHAEQDAGRMQRGL